MNLESIQLSSYFTYCQIRFLNGRNIDFLLGCELECQLKRHLGCQRNRHLNCELKRHRGCLLDNQLGHLACVLESSSTRQLPQPIQVKRRQNPARVGN